MNNQIAAIVLSSFLIVAVPTALRAQERQSCVTACDAIGYLSKNPYLSGSTASPFSKYDPNSPTNPYSRYGSRYSPDGARNPYTSGGLHIYGSDGTYLGRLNANSYDPESVANPYGRYGSRYSPTSVKNPYSRYGSPYSRSSATNPYGLEPPALAKPASRKRPDW